MTADLMIPMFILIIMYILIDVFDSGLVLISIALIWLPISFVMSSIITTNGYTHLFGAPIGNVPMSIEIIGLMAFTVPLFAIVKMLYVRKMMIGEEEHRDDDND